MDDDDLPDDIRQELKMTRLAYGTAEGKAAKYRLKDILADAAWWRKMVPIGWALYGFNYRDNAAFLSPTGRVVEVDLELLLALQKQSH